MRQRKFILILCWMKKLALSAAMQTVYNRSSGISSATRLSLLPKEVRCGSRSSVRDPRFALT